MGSNPILSEVMRGSKRSLDLSITFEGFEPGERGRGNGSFPAVEESKPQGFEEPLISGEGSSEAEFHPLRRGQIDKNGAG